MTLNEYIENFYEPRVILSHSETDFPVAYNFRDITLDLLKDYDKIVFSTKRMRTLSDDAVWQAQALRKEIEGTQIITDHYGLALVSSNPQKVVIGFLDLISTRGEYVDYLNSLKAPTKAVNVLFSDKP